jgi:hypothetical protein
MLNSSAKLSLALQASAFEFETKPLTVGSEAGEERKSKRGRGGKEERHGSAYEGKEEKGKQERKRRKRVEAGRKRGEAGRHTEERSISFAAVRHISANSEERKILQRQTNKKHRKLGKEMYNEHKRRMVTKKADKLKALRTRTNKQSARNTEEMRNEHKRRMEKKER